MTLHLEQKVWVDDPSDPSRATPSSVRIWFAPGTGWRVELTTVDHPDGPHQEIWGSDGTTFWGYDATSKQYMLQAVPEAGDPRALFLAGEFGIPTSPDLSSQIAAWQAISGNIVTRQGKERVAGRDAQVVLISSTECSTSSGSRVTAHGVATLTPQTSCTTRTSHYWFDTETGWGLKLVGDGLNGETDYADTVSAIFDTPIDPSLFHFTPPPGSVQVPNLN